MITAAADAVRAHATALARRGDDLMTLGRTLQAIPMPADWTGAGADAFRAAYAPRPARWLAAADAHHDAATAVSYYADVLDWAQRQDVVGIPFGPGGEQLREALDRIASQVRAAGDAAAGAVTRAASTAPTDSPLTGGIQRLTNDISDAATTIAASVAPASSTVVPSPVDQYGRVTGPIGLGDFSTITEVLGAATTGNPTPQVDLAERLEARNKGPKPPGVPDENPPPGVPKGWLKRPAESGKGWYWQRPDVNNDSDQVRIMDDDADTRYPHGYVRFYNGHNQPVDSNGKPTSRADSHISRHPDGSYDVPQEWNP